MISSQARTIIRLYVQEGLSRDKIALKLDLPHSTITDTLRKSGVKMRPPRTPTIVSELTISKPRPPLIENLKGQVIVRHQIRLTKKLAYLLGWIVGDGYSNRREIDAIVSLRECRLIEPFAKGLLSRFGKILVVPRNGTHIIRCSSTKLARVLCTATGQRHWKNVDFILESPSFAAAFIAGLWDADGGIFRESSGAFRAHLYSSNLLLLERIADALSKQFRIEVTIYKRKTNEFSPDSKIHEQSDRFDLYVQAEGNNRWAKYIGRLMLLPWKMP
jgi:LAGLIDADG DNA endonuclease family protein